MGILFYGAGKFFCWGFLKMNGTLTGALHLHRDLIRRGVLLYLALLLMGMKPIARRF
jgi:hypothetical protein